VLPAGDSCLKAFLQTISFLKSRLPSSAAFRSSFCIFAAIVEGAEMSMGWMEITTGRRVSRCCDVEIVVGRKG